MGVRETLGRPDLNRLYGELAAKRLNFDPVRRAHFIPSNGWRNDFYRQALPGEAPGPPAGDGSWHTARAVMWSYEFADPSTIRAFFPPSAPLDGRDMLLEGRFLALRFYFGVRVNSVFDSEQREDGRRVRVSGWSYATLEGHLEKGEMTYEVRKWLDTGEVEFRIHAFSRIAEIANPFVWLGFRLFGRGLQTKFARRACERMAALTAARLAAGSSVKLEA